MNLPPELDTREMPLSLRLAPPLELKLDAATVAHGIVAGYAATFGGPPDSYGEIIRKGAFGRTLEEHRAANTMPIMLWAHDISAPIGRWIEAREDDVGLYVRGLVNLETSRGKDAHAHLRGGDVGGLSIGYRVAENGRTISGGVATLTDLDLFECSVVALPANLRARISEVKSLASKRKLEALLHDAGLAKAAAVKVAAGGWPALNGEDPETFRLADRLDAATRELKSLKG